MKNTFSHALYRLSDYSVTYDNAEVAKKFDANKDVRLILNTVARLTRERNEARAMYDALVERHSDLVNSF